MFVVPTKIALRFKAEAHSWDRQYKYNEMHFSLRVVTGQSDHHWAVYNVGEKRCHKMKGMFPLQKHASSALQQVYSAQERFS